MFKKSICLFLAIVLSIGICACSVKTAEQKPSDGTEVSTSQSAETTAPSEEITAKSDTGKTTAKEKTTAADTTAQTKKSSAGQSAQGKGSAAKPAQKKAKQPQTTASKKSTTKQPTSSKKTALTVTFTINCAQALGKVSGLPDSGYFLKGAKVQVKAGASVYDALLKCCDAEGVTVVATNTMYGKYVSAIGGLAEFDTGKASGWTYTVNGKYPPKACDKYALTGGEHVEFIYKAG